MVKKEILKYFNKINPNIVQDDIIALDKIKIADIIDSLGMLEFLIFIEKKFKIEISDLDITRNNFQTIADVILFIKKGIK